ncbi:MAG: lipoyl(octanoyl) transferase LipB [Synechococcales cyanobacterium RM1_1_8]|nr:lipoyl(octanoyl) transferase LipB [Synechococcales cyanobacterium RM1_1_8]
MDAGPSRPGRLLLLGISPYGEILELQRSLLTQRCQNPDLPDILLLLQHPPVYTLGRGASLEFLNFDPPQAGRPAPELHRIGRGGEVTYHCPGQLVGYPILNLARHRPDLHWYLRQLEAVAIAVLADYGLVGERIDGLTGVWVEGRKLAAIGIQVRRWITMHGFALNVCPDLSGFEQIVPCGIGDRPVGSMAQWLPDISLVEVQQRALYHFGEIFGLDWRSPTPDEAPYFSTVTPFQNAT